MIPNYLWKWRPRTRRILQREIDDLRKDVTELTIWMRGSAKGDIKMLQEAAHNLRERVVVLEESDA